MGSIFWAQNTNTNLVIQQVGITLKADKATEAIGFFLQEAFIGKSDRQKLRLVSASTEDMSLLNITKLSALVLFTLYETNEQALINLTFIDSDGTNTILSFASLSLSKWMKQIEDVQNKLYLTISERYPPKLITEIKTIKVKTYSPYEVKGQSIAMGGGVGYSGHVIELGNVQYKGVKNPLQEKIVTGPAFHLFLLRRTGLWYTEWQIHGFFSDTTSLLAEANIGYGIFDGIISPLVGGMVSYAKRSYEIVNNVTQDKYPLEFSTFHGFPILGLRICF